MSRLIEALKNFGKKCNTSETAPSGDTVEDVINNIAASFDINGADGQDGAYVTAIALTTTEGAVTGGTATLSDGSTISITVTEG